MHFFLNTTLETRKGIYWLNSPCIVPRIATFETSELSTLPTLTRCPRTARLMGEMVPWWCPRQQIDSVGRWFHHVSVTWWSVAEARDRQSFNWLASRPLRVAPRHLRLTTMTIVTKWSTSAASYPNRLLPVCDNSQTTSPHLETLFNGTYTTDLTDY